MAFWGCVGNQTLTSVCTYFSRQAIPAWGLENLLPLWEIAAVKTLTVDSSKRIRIPDAKPNQVFAYENHGDGTITLTEVQAEAKEPFPPGSLKKYVTQERNKELLEIFRGCSLEVPASVLLQPVFFLDWKSNIL